MPQDGLVFDSPAEERAGDECPLLVREIPYRDPVTAFAPWFGQPFGALLHSAAEAGGRGRWSIVAVEPFRTIEAQDRSVTVDGHAVAGDPFTVLEEQLEAHRLTIPPDLPVPFAGGAVGFLGYELGQVLERLPARHADDTGLPDMAFGLYDTVIVFNELDRRGWILSSGFPEHGPVGRRLRAADRLHHFAERLEAAPAVLPPPNAATAS